jgi:hypothetical protein
MIGLIAPKSNFKKWSNQTLIRHAHIINKLKYLELLNTWIKIERKIFY